MSKTVYFDMDDVLCFFTEALESLKTNTDKWPHHGRGFYSKVKPNHDAITVFKTLELHGFKCRILTAPSVMNPETYTGKACWVSKHFGKEWLPKMIIASEKDLLIGDYLIDDRVRGHGQEMFTGTLIHAPLGTNWLNVLNRLLES